MSRERLVDDHAFVVDDAHVTGSCRIQVFTGDGVRPVIVATQVVSREGVSLTNAAEAFMRAAWERFLLDEAEPPLWVENYVAARGAPDDRRCLQVEFTSVGGHGVADPRWAGLDCSVTDFVGADVDLTRGDSFALQPEEKRPNDVFQIMRVLAFPTPRPFRTDGCLNQRAPGLRWILASVRVGCRKPSPCCWYHSGDWRAVNDCVVQLVRQAHQAGTVDVRGWILERLESDLRGWQLDAARSLFMDPIVLPRPRRGRPDHYVNGQHRSAAMLDAGVWQTVVVVEAGDQVASRS